MAISVAYCDEERRMAREPVHPSSGVADLDRALGGLMVGDNIVWAYDDEPLITEFEDAFIKEGLRKRDPCYFIAAGTSPGRVRSRLSAEVNVFDARASKRFADPVLLEQTVVDVARSTVARFVFEGLDTYVRRLGPERALGLFSRICPQLFDLGSLAYWRASARSLGSPFVDSLRKVTQCVIELNAGRLRVVKAEGHGVGVTGRLLRVEHESDGSIRLRSERSLGRLVVGLRRVREERGLTQADLARLAKVSASAISQAEAGHRGLSLDTVVTLCEELHMSVDDLIAYVPNVDYVVARRDRTSVAGSSTALLDDPAAGLRAYLVNLPPGQAGIPPSVHKGVELVLVAAGLVQLDLGQDTPVMRPGDAMLARRVDVTSWRNLLGTPARLFWILRD
jgi:transcriptional regulator with XRE-family HTH domain